MSDGECRRMNRQRFDALMAEAFQSEERPTPERCAEIGSELIESACGRWVAQAATMQRETRRSLGLANLGRGGGWAFFPTAVWPRLSEQDVKDGD